MRRNCDGCHVRHEGNKQRPYREKKTVQLGQERNDALQKPTYSILKRRRHYQGNFESGRRRKSRRGMNGCYLFGEGGVDGLRAFLSEESDCPLA